MNMLAQYVGNDLIASLQNGLQDSGDGSFSSKAEPWLVHLVISLRWRKNNGLTSDIETLVISGKCLVGQEPGRSKTGRLETRRCLRDILVDLWEWAQSTWIFCSFPLIGEAMNNQEDSSCRYQPFSLLCQARWPVLQRQEGLTMEGKVS